MHQPQGFTWSLASVNWEPTSVVFSFHARLAESGFSWCIEIKVINQFFLGQLLQVPYSKVAISPMPSIFLCFFALVNSCIGLFIISLTVEVVQASHPSSNSYHLLVWVQYFTPSLSELNNLSSFCRLWHAQQVVRQIRHAQNFMQLMQLNVFAFRGFSFMIATKNKEGVWANRAAKYEKYVAGKCTRARAPLARKYTNRILESQDGTTSIKY